MKRSPFAIRLLFAATLLILVSGINELISSIATVPIPKDYIVYYSAYTAASRGVNPYLVAFLSPFQSPWYPPGYGPCPFLNPPWLLVFFSFIFKTALPGAFVTWKIVSVFSVIAASLFAIKARRIEEITVAITFALFNLPLWLCLQWGQLGGVLSLAVVMILVGISDNRPWIIGAGLAILSVKPLSFYLIPFIVFYLAYARSHKQLLPLMAPFVALFIATQIFFPRLLFDWIRSAFGSQAGTKESVFIFWTDTSGSLLSHALRLESPSSVLIAISMFMAVSITLRLVKNNNLTELEMLLFAIPLSVFTAPYGWMHDRVVLTLLPLFYWGKCSWETRAATILFLFLITKVATFVILTTGQAGAAWWYAPAILIYLIYLSKCSRRKGNS